MSTILHGRSRLDRLNPWERFSDWIISTQNRIYIGWFGLLMIPTLLVATICLVLVFAAVPHSQGRGIATNADIVNRATLGIQVMHSPNAHHFPLVLANGDAVPLPEIMPRDGELAISFDLS